MRNHPAGRGPPQGAAPCFSVLPDLRPGPRRPTDRHRRGRVNGRRCYKSRLTVSDQPGGCPDREPSRHPDSEGPAAKMRTRSSGMPQTYHYYFF